VAALGYLVLGAEQPAEERLGAVDVGGRQLVSAQGADVVDKHGADARPRLSERLLGSCGSAVA
jgi:hypothetical protein